MKQLLCFVVFLLPVIAFAQGQLHDNQVDNDPLFKKTSTALLPNNEREIPTFPGEFRSAINETQYYADHMQYPADAKAAQLTGVVRLTSVINAEGRVTEVRITQSLSPSTDAEAIRLVSQPKWTPAMKDGKPVSMGWKHEVHFRL